MTSLSIRRAKTGDIPSLRRVLKAAYEPHLSAIPDLPNVDQIEPEDLVMFTVWVAEKDDELCGLIMTRIDPPVAHLSNVAVHPNAAGAGLGRTLVDHVVQEARNAGCRVLNLATHPEMGANVAIYQRMGWEVTDASPTKVAMTREL